MPQSAVSPTTGPRAPAAVRPDHLRIFVRQLPFAAVLTLLVVGYVTFEPGVLEDARVLTGLLVALFATALTVTLPWHRLEVRWAVAIPLLDILAVGLVQSGGLNSGYLLVLPVLWMSMSYGLGGAVTSVVAGSLAAWSTELPVPDLTDLRVEEIQRLFLLPAILLAVSLYLYVAERRSAARRDLLGRQSAVLEETLVASRDQQRLLGTILDTIDVGVLTVGPDGVVRLTNRTHDTHARGSLRVGDRVDRDFLARAQGRGEDGATPLGEEALPLELARNGNGAHRITWWEDGDQGRAYRVSARSLPGDHGEGGAVVAYQDLTTEMAAQRQLEDFVSSVSHELRTPLTSIMGYLDLALDDDIPERTRAQLEVAERNSDRLLRLIGDLLTAAQTRRGQLSLVRTPVDLGYLARETVQSHRPRATEADVSVEVRLTESWVRADRSRLTQVIDNLLSNAIKYSRPGGHVVVTTHPDGDGVRLTVRDDGIGIAPADQEKLFSRFFRADAVRSGPVQGTGLGLHISRQIVEAHGGTITLVSEQGWGTEVTVVLPAPEDT